MQIQNIETFVEVADAACPTINIASFKNSKINSIACLVICKVVSVVVTVVCSFRTG